MIKKIQEFGINRKRQKNTWSKTGINTKNLFITIKKNLAFKVEILLKKEQVNRGKFLKENIKKNVEFLIELKNYKGNRHKLKYPVRGQRTHTNAKTRTKFKI